MSLFRPKLQYLRIDEETLRDLVEVRHIYTSNYVLLKVRPMAGESAHLSAPEHMLNVIHAIEHPCSFEIWLEEGRITFYFYAVDSVDADLIKAQVSAHYPNAEIEEVESPYKFPVIRKDNYLAGARVKMQRLHYYPFETKFTVDPLASLLSSLSYAKTCDKAIVQVIMKRAKDGWNSDAHDRIWKLTNEHSEGWIDPHVVKPTESGRELAKMLNEKAGKLAFQVEFNILVIAKDPAMASCKVRELAASFSQFNLSHGNGFGYNDIKSKKLADFTAGMAMRWLAPLPLLIGRNRYAMTTTELSNIVHLPKGIETQDVESVRLKQRTHPITREEDKEDGLTICESTWRGKTNHLHLTEEDLNTHVAVFGKTGFGKSTVIAQMALQKINNGDSVIVIDPHGDLIKEIVPRIDRRRCNDIILVDPIKYPLRLNVLTIPNRGSFSSSEMETMKDIVISDLVSTLKNIYGEEYWGPRLDYIFTTIAKGLLEKEGTTLLDMYYILTNGRTRRKFGDEVKNEIVRNFVKNELPQMQYDVLLSTVNKVGKIAGNEVLRKMLCQRSGTFDIKGALDSGKVLLIDLSKGRLGPENTNVLGSAVVTQLWMNVLQRADVPDSKRKRTYLFVDEFQNFASQSFTEILSESRKYKLSLIIATQYTQQVHEKVWKGIKANVNTFISFALGADDAFSLSKVYTDVEPEEFINLDKFKVIVRKGAVTTQGDTINLDPAQDSDNESRIRAIRDKDVLDDSLFSEYMDWGEEKLNVLITLRALKFSKKRDKFAMCEIMKELERIGRPSSTAIMDNILRECETNSWVIRTWNGEIFENGITPEGERAIQDLMGNTATAGAGHHKNMIMINHKYWTMKGCAVKVVRQGGANPLPDVSVEDGEYLMELTGGMKAYVEIECTTIRNPSRILENLKKSKIDGRCCIFSVDKMEIAVKIADIIKHPYKNKNNGDSEYYLSETGKPFIPEQEFPSPIERKDWKIMVLSGESDFVEYSEKCLDDETGEIDPENDDRMDAEIEKERVITTNIGKVEKFLEEHSGTHKPIEICTKLGLSMSIVTTALCRLITRKIIERFGTGNYIHRKWAAYNTGV
jgi:hypothetical protein